MRSVKHTLTDTRDGVGTGKTPRSLLCPTSTRIYLSSLHSKFCATALTCTSHIAIVFIGGRATPPPHLQMLTGSFLPVARGRVVKWYQKYKDGMYGVSGFFLHCKFKQTYKKNIKNSAQDSPPFFGGGRAIPSNIGSVELESNPRRLPRPFPPLFFCLHFFGLPPGVKGSPGGKG